VRTVFSRLDNVFRRQPPGQTGLTAEYVHVRTPIIEQGEVGVCDTPRQSDIPSRPSRWDITFWWHDQNRVAEGQFIMPHLPSARQLGIMRGRMRSDPQRVNIPVPSHVAYGSLFQAPTSPYGYS
jgi:hypothetical protein